MKGCPFSTPHSTRLPGQSKIILPRETWTQSMVESRFWNTSALQHQHISTANDRANESSQTNLKLNRRPTPQRKSACARESKGSALGCATTIHLSDQCCRMKRPLFSSLHRRLNIKVWLRLTLSFPHISLSLFIFSDILALWASDSCACGWWPLSSSSSAFCNSATCGNSTTSRQVQRKNSTNFRQ